MNLHPAWWVVIALLLLSSTWWGVKRRAAGPSEPATPPAILPHSPEEMVRLDARRTAHADGRETWRLEFAPESDAGRIELEFTLTEVAESSDPRLRMGIGTLRSCGEGNGRTFLDALAAALGTEVGTRAADFAESLRFDVGILGSDLAMQAAEPGGSTFAGSFTDRPAGSWVLTKFFLAEGEAEVFFALDARAGRALFLPKDSEYAEAVVQEIARLFR